MSRGSPNVSQAKTDDSVETTPPAMPDQLTGNGSSANDEPVVVTDDDDDSDGASASNPLDGLASMPDVQPHAIDAAGEAAKTTAATNAKYPGFDPNIHESDPVTGEPRKTKSGGYRMKRGRGAKSFGGQSTFKATGAAPGAGPAPSAADTAADRESKIKSTAVVVSEMLFMGGKLFGGAEWEPRVDRANGIDERAMMNGAWENYFRIRGIMEVPPEIMLAVAIGGYAVPRFFQPQTKSRVQKMKEWFYQYVARRRARRSSTPIDVSIVP